MSSQIKLAPYSATEFNCSLEMAGEDTLAAPGNMSTFADESYGLPKFTAPYR